MADFLKFINELTVNGKPVDDEDDDDYTTPAEEDDDKPELDLDPAGGEGETTIEDDDTIDNDDYTVEPEDPEPAEDTVGNEPDLDLNPGEDPEPAAEPEGEPAEDTDTEPTEEPATDNNPDDTGDTDGTEDGLDMSTDDTGDMGDDDYTTTGDDDPNASTDDDGDSSLDDTSTDGESSEDSELETKIKQTEAEIFNALSDDEKAIKNRQLIDSFIDLKKITKVFLEKIQTVTVTEENDKILAFIETSLLDLNNMITDYIITRYNKKSYIENAITYQQFILTIEQLKEIVSKLNIDENPQK